VSESAGEFDVVIIGGGPAGSTTALALASTGLRVGLFERTRFPRHHIGESLLARTVPYLKRLGVWEELNSQSYIVKPGALFVWGGQSEPAVLDMPPPGYSFQVPRQHFDELLLRRARERGVTVHETHDVTKIAETPEAVSISGTADGREWTARARHVVDASGGSRFTGRKLGYDYHEYDGARIAVSAYFSGASRVPAPHEGRIITEACASGWIWFIPLDDDLTSVGLVSDARRLRGAGSPLAALTEELATAPYTSRHLQSAELTSDPAVIRYANYAIESPKWLRRIVRVGDAAMFVDPLFSTGVHGAVSSGYMAGAALNSVLADAVTDEAAADAYNRNCDEYFDRTRETVRLLYGFHPGTTPFWRERAITQMSAAQAARSLAILGVPGAAVFVSLIDKLPMPAEFVDQLSQVVLPKPLAPLSAGSALRLHGDSVVNSEFVFSGLGLAPGLSVRNAKGHTVALNVPAGLRQERLVRDLVAARADNRDVIIGPQHSELLAGALASSGNAYLSSTADL
jgi:FAD-dependent halogenase